MRECIYFNSDVEPKTMLIHLRSAFSGQINSMNLDVTEDQLVLWKVKNYLIQDAMPNLSDVEREFLITGMTEEEQIEFYSQFEEEE